VNETTDAYDTIWYVRALTSWREGTAPKTKNKKETKNKNRVAQKKKSG